MKGLDIPARDPHSTPTSKPVITDASLEDANRIIFSPWAAISQYEEPVTGHVIDIPGNIGASAGPGDTDRKNKTNTARPEHSPEQIANKLNISTENEKSNKSSSFSQLVMRVQSVHFHKVSLFIFNGS